MKKQIAMNVFFYVGIFVSVVGLKWAWQNQNYPVVALFVATTIFFFYLKIKLIRDIRGSIKDKSV
jgi:Flp pilus assembly protein TadB